MKKLVLTGAVLLTLTGCFHAKVTTSDEKPSTVLIERPWASSWIYGLVPPKPIEATDKCKTGVVQVETKLSFLNQLVGALTLGIYTPMNIKVTCAE